MLVFAKNEDLVSSCHNSQEDYVLEASKSHKVKIAGIAVAIAGLLVSLLGLLLFILCGAVPLSVAISLATVGMILLLCGVVLSIVFYYRRRMRLKSALLLDGPIQVESRLSRLNTNIIDLKTKIESLSNECPRFKERLESLSVAFVNGMVASHSKLSKEFHKDMKTEASLKQEIESLEGNYNRCSESVNLNFQLYNDIKSVENLCQKIGFSNKDTEIILEDLMKMQEDALSLSVMILQKESLTSSEVADYKKELEDFFNKGRSAYDFVVTETTVLEEFQSEEDGNKLKDIFTEKIRDIGSLMGLYSDNRLIALEKDIQNRFNTEFKDTLELVEKFFQERLGNLSRLQEGIRSHSLRCGEDIPKIGGIRAIEQFRSLTDSIVRILKKQKEVDSQELERKVAGKVYSSFLETISDSKTSRKDESLEGFLSKIMMNSASALGTEVNNYLLVLMNLKSLIFDFGHFLSPVAPHRSALLQKLHNRADALAEISEISLTEEEKSVQNEEILLKKFGFLVKKFSDKQEKYLCTKGYLDSWVDLGGRIENKSEDESLVILDNFVKEITEKKKNLPNIENLVQKRSLVDEWEKMAGSLSEQINVFSKVSHLFEQRLELKKSYAMKNLTKEDKIRIKGEIKKNKSDMKLMKNSLQTPLEKEYFERLQDKNNRESYREGMKLIREFYDEANSCFQMLIRKEALGSLLSLLNNINTDNLKETSKDDCMELMDDVKNMITGNEAIVRSLMNLKVEESLEEANNYGRFLEATRIDLEKLLEENLE